MDEHLESMIELGLISRIEDNERSFYKITNLGVRYVKLYTELKGLLDYQIEKQVGIRYLKYIE